MKSEPPAPPELDPALVSELHELLSQSAWQVDLKWSVLDMGDPIPTRRWRYTFLPKTNAASNEESRWKGLFDGKMEGVEPGEAWATMALLNRWASEDTVLGVNSAILLKRWTLERGHTLSREIVLDGRTLEQPERAARGDVQEIPLATRCAAAETWCRAPNSACVGVCDDYDRDRNAGELLQRPGLPDELRGTIWRVLTDRIPPDSIPGLSKAINEGRNQTLRRAALEACILHALSRSEIDAAVWPERIDSARSDPDPILRQLFARWVALSRPNDAVKWLNELCRDITPSVQEQSVHGLGLLKTDEARTVLRQIVPKSGERLRSIGVQALANWGVEEITPFLRDKSVEVRAAAVTALAADSSEAAQRLMRECLSDQSLEVQSSVITAVSHWPNEAAVPVLLEGIRTGALRTRQQSQDELRRLLMPNISFPIDAPATERDQAVRSWAAIQGWKLDQIAHPVTITTLDAEAHADRVQECIRASFNSTESEDSLDELRILLQVSDIPVAERMLLTRSDPVAEKVAHELLPSLSPVHAAVEQLEDRSVARRRQAARQLAELAADQPLSPFVLSRLRENLSREQDQSVWQACMAAVQHETHEDAAQIALVAMHNTWPDVRRLGVEYVSEHPTAEAARWLVPLFGDRERSVKLAAIIAAGRAGNPGVIEGLPAIGEVPAQPGLRSLMTDTDPELRWAVLISMSKLRDDSACQELIRLSFDPYSPTREQAIAAMAQSGQRRFIEPLLKRLWTEPQPHVQRTILATLEELVPPENHPRVASGLAAPPSIDDKIRAWAAWRSRESRVESREPEQMRTETMSPAPGSRL